MEGEQKKRGRKSKKDEISATATEPVPAQAETAPDEPIFKKRGRKPKGGKILTQTSTTNVTKEVKPNIILHLKCFIKDLEDSFKSCLLSGYTISNMCGSCDVQDRNTNQFMNLSEGLKIEKSQDSDEDNVDDENENDNVKNIWKKIKMLEHNLHNNQIDKPCACFWDSYEFDNPPIYIPKSYINDSYQVYGCFCSPECAVAYLMKENIDSSVKFERYQLINHVYSKIFGYGKNIKPSPNPHYMLDRFYGNMTIQEYRSLLRNDRLFLVVDKPLTRIMPELHEDNDDFIINNKIIPTNATVAKKIGGTKNDLLTTKFGFREEKK